jgi:hypothetical protein
MTPLLLRPRRAPRTSRLALSHSDRRLMLHRHGHFDWQRLVDANAEIGMTGSPFSGIFGNLNAALHYLPCHTARVIQFPGHRTEIARLRVEIEELRKTVRGGCC